MEIRGCDLALEIPFPIGQSTVKPLWQYFGRDLEKPNIVTLRKIHHINAMIGRFQVM